MSEERGEYRAEDDEFPLSDDDLDLSEDDSNRDLLYQILSRLDALGDQIDALTEWYGALERQIAGTALPPSPGLRRIAHLLRQSTTPSKSVP